MCVCVFAPAAVIFINQHTVAVNIRTQTTRQHRRLLGAGAQETLRQRQQAHISKNKWQKRFWVTEQRSLGEFDVVLYDMMTRTLQSAQQLLNSLKDL